MDKAAQPIATRFQEFLIAESASAIILLTCTIMALVWANSPWSPAYFSLWHTPLTIGAPALGLTMDLRHWINDGLMALFFFLVGLEIKRELVVGELSQLKQALLPVVGAVGGMLFPALIYSLVNIHSAAAHGWGIPVATDIAFALAIITALGSRVPTGLKVFLVALAIVDDLGAVLVIALFYAQEINFVALGLAAAGLLIAVTLNWRTVANPLPYAAIGLLVWVAILSSGVHAAVAGVLMAFCIPARSRIDVHRFSSRCRQLLRHFENTIASEGNDERPEMSMLRLSGEQQEIVGEIERVCEQVESPLDRLEHDLHPWIAYLVMPLFALANAGVALPTNFSALFDSVSLGVLLGLVLGKQLGVTLFIWLSVRIKLTALPNGVNWLQLYAASWVCGVGFTMSLFISSLAFGEEPLLEDSAKVGILAASIVAGLVGYLILNRSLRPAEQP